MIIEQTDPRAPQAIALLHASHALMEKLFPPEDNCYLSITDLCAPNIRFFTAREGGTLLGCGALKNLQAYGELKSMFTAPSARGKGAASAILVRIEQDARALNLSALKLETGDLLHNAHKLYAKHGFTLCGPFGDYAANKTSLFMEKPL